MRKFIVGLAITAVLLLTGYHPASAQTVNLWCWTGPTAPEWQPCSAANPLSVTGSFTATTTGFPGSTQTTGTPIAVTTGGVTGTLPTGAVVVATNVGTTNIAYCKLGASATTSDQAISPNGGWFAFTVGTNTQLTCITSTSTTTVNMVGGAGLPTGTGGGGTIPGVATAANQATNTATTAHTCSVAGFSELGCLGQIDDDVKGPIAAGTNIVGKVGIDQTTPGTTNGVQVNAALPAGTNNIGLVTTALATSGGYTTSFFQPAASDNHTNLKNGAGQVYWVLAENNSATVNYLRFYNAATGFNGCNSATNLVAQIQIPANTAVGGVNLALPFGIPFSTGISYCVTSGYATNDTTNATATAMSITIGYN